VLCIPHVGKNQIVSADQFQASIGLRLVDYDLRTRASMTPLPTSAPFT
jgi:hypothetical protein